MKKLLILLALIALFTTSCTKNNDNVADNEDTNNTEQQENELESADEIEENESQGSEDKVTIAPDFELETLDGSMIKLSNLRDKNVIINFWGIWCGFCVEEMPDLQKLQDTYKNEDLLILAVNVGDTKEDIEEFMEENNLTLTVLLDKDLSVQNMYGVSSFPSTLGVNKKREVVAGHIGMLSYEQMEQLYEFFED